jgi:hypothetical protein
MQMAMAFTHQKPIQRKRVGELPEGLPGSIVERGMRGEKRQELGRPVSFLTSSGMPIQPQGGRQRMARESDHPIVLGERESRSHGEGGDGGTEPSEETCAGHVGPESPSQPP